MKKYLTIFSIVAVTLACSTSAFSGEHWSEEKVNDWYAKQPWPVGVNYITSTAINQIEMWQEESFDPETIDRELGWAADLGFNTVRVFGHDLLWKTDAEGYKARIDQFLDICEKHNLRVIFTFFTNGGPGLLAKMGEQPEPKKGVHMAAWYMSPGPEIANHPENWGDIEKYVKDIISTYKDDERILLWHLYNEPIWTRNGVHALPLLREVFTWAREINPSQPLSSSICKKEYNPINVFLLENCDVLTFQRYTKKKDMVETVKLLKAFGRPVICTEYLARPDSLAKDFARRELLGHSFQEMMPFFKKEKVGAINFGLVLGKTNTAYPWQSKEGSPEPKIWFHDILRADGTPYSEEEVEFIKSMTKTNNINE